MEEYQSSILIYTLLGTSAMLLMSGAMGVFVIMHQRKISKVRQKQAKRELEYQEQMIQLQLESQEQERKRIGADLHDSLGSLLWGAKVNASLIKRSTELKEDAKESHDELSKILDESILTVRRISWELTPEAFHYSGLSESIKKICSQLGGKTMQIILQDSQAKLWNDDRALLVFRIVQELISNAVKHSEGTQLHIQLNWEETQLEVNIADNGKGIQSQERKGVGMWNIEHRVKQLKAEIHIGNPPMGTGTEIWIKIPLNHDEA